MKKRSIILFLAVLACVSAAFAAEGGRPKISVKAPRHDLGSVAAGDRASHVFEIKNEGDATLVIERIQPG